MILAKWDLLAVQKNFNTCNCFKEGANKWHPEAFSKNVY